MKSGIKIKVIPVESFISGFSGETNCFVIWMDGLAVVVDPGGEAEKISRFLKRNKLEVGAYWLTHAHPDHVGGLSELIDEFPAPVCYHRADSLWIRTSLPVASIRKSEWLRPFGAIRRITCVDIRAKVILTPGHTRGGVCYWFDQLGVLLTGDTVQRDGRGLTCYPGGDANELQASLKRISRIVPPQTKILPGHGGATTVGRESVAVNHERKTSMNKKKTIMSKVYTSFDEVTRAYNKVRMELWDLGVLWDGSKMDGVECIYEPLQLLGLVGYMGFYRFDDGNIHFPAIYNGLDFRFSFLNKNSAVDVIRHEFGHALADRYPGALKKGDMFRAAFGGSYGDKPAKGADPDDWEDRCVTPYAATKTQEDFAETFMLFMKHKGKIPAKFAKKPAIRKKWKAVAEIVRRVAAGTR